jgi:hypothetical protein
MLQPYPEVKSQSLVTVIHLTTHICIYNAYQQLVCTYQRWNTVREKLEEISLSVSEK